MYNKTTTYDVEALVGDVGVVDTRVGRHDSALQHVGRDLRLFGRDVNLRRQRRTVQEVSMCHHEAALVDRKAPAAVAAVIGRMRTAAAMLNA